MRAPTHWCGLAAVCLTIGVACACRGEGPPPNRASAEAAAGGTETQSAPPARIAIRSSRFYAGTVPFEWRGITAFALLEQIAHGREAEAGNYLQWAASRQLTVVRVLTMAQHLFKLTPEEGRAALPRLLEMAATLGLYVEIVALADTADVDVDLDAHVKAIGAAAAAHANALIEIANEPGHPTQRREIHDPERLAALAALIPDDVPVALGSAEYGDAFAAGAYATYHFPRDPGDNGWGHVLRLAEGAGLGARWGKPVVSDEPIGAGPRFVAGRRDNEPARLSAAALLTRVAGLYPTFHYEGGLLATIPTGPELEAFKAWIAAVLVGERVAWSGSEFLQGDAVRAVAQASGARAVFGRAGPEEAWILLVDPHAEASVHWTPGWRADGEWEAPGARLLRGRREN